MRNYDEIQADFERKLSFSQLNSLINGNVSAMNGGPVDSREAAFEVFSLIGKTVEALESDINQYRSSYDSAVSALKESFSDSKKELERTRDRRIALANNEADNKIKSIEQAMDGVREEIKKNQVSIDLENSRFMEMGALSRLLESSVHEGVIRNFEKAIEQGQDSLTEYERAKKAARDYCEKCLDGIRAEYRKSVAEKEPICNRYIEKCGKSLDEAVDNARESAVSFLKKVASDERFIPFEKRAEASLTDFDNFRAMDAESFAAPGTICLGSVGRTVLGPGKGELSSVLRKTGLSCFDCSSRTDGSIIAETVLTSDLAEGLQVVIRPRGNDDATWDNDNVRWLAYKLLALYPAGKLQLTMIDPLKNGSSFSGIPNIVDKNHEWLISGGVITQSEFISQALRALEQKIAGFAQSYGAASRGVDKDSYFRKELVQAVFINDFPNGFDASAVASLSKLMENGDDYGMIFVIGMNPSYERNFLGDPNYKAIFNRKNLICLEGRSASYLEMKKNGALYTVALFDGESIDRNTESIVTELREGIVHSGGFSRQEDFGNLGDIANPHTWLQEVSNSGVSIPVGIKGASTAVQVHVGIPGTTMHHGLISGTTGSGKSSLMHTMIMSTILRYSADEVRLVIIDFKEGEEFRVYSRYNIPSFMSITTATEPELAYAALRGLKKEFDNRVKGQVESGGRIILIFDEVQALFADNVRQDIRSGCEAIIRELVLQGRSAGIHIFLGSQNFERVPCLKDLWSDMKIRLVLKDAPADGILEEADALQDVPAGKAILNTEGGRAGKNEQFQMALLRKEDRAKYLEDLERRYADAGNRYDAYQRTLLFTNVEDNPEHPFAEFMRTGKLPLDTQTASLLYLGNILRSDVDDTYRAAGRRFALSLEKSNLLLIGSDTSTAQSLLVFSLLSLLLNPMFDAAHGCRGEIYLCDFTEGDEFAKYEKTNGRDIHANVQSLFRLVPNRITHIDTVEDGLSDDEGLSDFVDRIYETLKQRIACAGSAEEAQGRIYLVMEHIGVGNSIVEASRTMGYGQGSLLDKIQFIIKEGPFYGIHTIVWGQDVGSSENVLNANSDMPLEQGFATRIVFKASEEDFKRLTNCSNLPVTQKGAIFKKRNSVYHFRPFDLPRLDWVSSVCAMLEKQD